LKEATKHKNKTIRGEREEDMDPALKEEGEAETQIKLSSALTTIRWTIPLMSVIPSMGTPLVQTKR